jgi:hypothetical protein
LVSATAHLLASAPEPKASKLAAAGALALQVAASEQASAALLDQAVASFAAAGVP